MFAQENVYPWLTSYAAGESIVHRIGVPEGCERISVERGSFGDWLRHLPLKKGTPRVYLFDGRLKQNQTTHWGVVDIDVGHADLQQCADAIIRLRAEYLFSRMRFDDIRFNFTSGYTARYSKWRDGHRPVVRANDVHWIPSARRDTSYKAFRDYLTSVFTYAGSHSLSRECEKVGSDSEPDIGDIFIEGGYPGHALIIVDIAINKETGKRLFLLAQSYMPAQDIHILVNPSNPKLSPWYEVNVNGELPTPEWRFPPDSAMRFG
jgi:hypothetical protein